jgi:uncharacterized membrane protein
MPHLLAFLRALHILAGALWVGAATFNALYLIPATMAAGPAGGKVMGILVQVRRLPVFMNTVMLVTLLTGLHLYQRASGGLNPAWIASRPGLMFTIGAVLALVTAGIGWFVTVPTVRKVGARAAAIGAAEGPPDPAAAAEMRALQRRILVAARIGSVLIVLSLLCMAMARYV